MLKQLNENAQIAFGRNLEPGELEQRALVSPPEVRETLIRKFRKELERDDLSIRERSELLDAKSRLAELHERMSKVYR